MRDRNRSMSPLLIAAGFAIALFGSGCGDESLQAPLAIEFSTTSQAVLTGVDRVIIHLHAGRQTCTALERTGPDFEALYSAEIELRKVQMAAESTIFNIVEDTYTASAWGFGVLGAASVFGCSPPFAVERGQEANVEIELRRLF